MLIIWAGLPAHRSRVVRQHVESLDGRIAIERLAGYASELDPVECLFGYAKQRELATLSLDSMAAWSPHSSCRVKAKKLSRRLY